MTDDNKTPVTDDQELAKVLASMNQQAAQQASTPTDPSAATPASSTPDSATTDTPVAQDGSALVEDVPPIPATLPATMPNATPESSVVPPVEPEVVESPASSLPPVSMPMSSGSGALDDIKRQALEQLRPIVGKLDLPAEEKFDALLLVIRSSDDQSLIGAAYQAAESIADDAKKAQALLDIVKEIEYFSSQSK